MQRIELSKELIQAAALSAEEAEKTHNNIEWSVSDHEGLFAGYLGEYTFNDKTGAHSVEGSRYHDTLLNGFKMEVKTKQSKWAPRLYKDGEPMWEGTVPCYLDSLHENPETRPDYFVFFNVKYSDRELVDDVYRYKVSDLECIYYGGFMTFEDYMDKRRHIPAKEQYSTNNRLVHTDQWNIYWSELEFENLRHYDLTNSNNLV